MVQKSKRERKKGKRRERFNRENENIDYRPNRIGDIFYINWEKGKMGWLDRRGVELIQLLKK